jgi:TPR repeat protein
MINSLLNRSIAQDSAKINKLPVEQRRCFLDENRKRYEAILEAHKMSEIDSVITAFYDLFNCRGTAGLLALSPIVVPSQLISILEDCVLKSKNFNADFLLGSIFLDKSVVLIEFERGVKFLHLIQKTLHFFPNGTKREKASKEIKLELLELKKASKDSPKATFILGCYLLNDALSADDLITEATLLISAFKGKYPVPPTLLGKAFFVSGKKLLTESSHADKLSGSSLILEAENLKFPLPHDVLGEAYYTVGSDLLNQPEPKKISLGAKHLIKAAVLECVKAYRQTATIYEDGNYGVLQDLAEAFKWLAIAAANDPGNKYEIKAEMKRFHIDYGHEFVKEGMAKAKLQIDSWDRAKTVPVLPA